MCTQIKKPAMLTLRGTAHQYTIHWLTSALDRIGLSLSLDYAALTMKREVDYSAPSGRVDSSNEKGRKYSNLQSNLD